MAVSAYILIQTEVGKAAQVATEVRGIDGVVAANDVTGPYNVIARAEAPTMDDLGKMVVSRVQMSRASRDPHVPGSEPLTRPTSGSVDDPSHRLLRSVAAVHPRVDRVLEVASERGGAW